MNKIDKVLIQAIEEGASDVHIMPKEIHLRVDGVLKKIKEVDIQESQHMIHELIGKRDLVNDMDFSYSIKDRGRFRVNVAKQRGTLCSTIRYIKTKIPEFEELGLPEKILDVCSYKKGMFIVTGPTNSGKSTTLATMIDYINRNFNKKIVTIEDPIEYLHTNNKSVVVQREVGEDTTFSMGLRSVLRQDPDVILIGEMRDKETMETAITASETGHLVLATMHTKDSVSSINRIIDMFPPEQKGQILSQLGDNLVGIFSQNLIPSLKGGLVLGYEKLILNRAIRNQIKADNISYIKQSMQTNRDCKTISKHLDELIKNKFITPQQKTEIMSED